MTNCSLAMPEALHFRKTLWLAFLLSALLFTNRGVIAAEQSTDPKALYDSLRSSHLSGDAYRVEHLTLKRDRINLELTGDVYTAAPVNGKTYGAVFIGQGRMTAEPYSTFEKNSIARFLQADRIDVTFSRAVLRFTDDTADWIAQLPHRSGIPPEQAQQAFSELEGRILKRSGLNLSARLASSIVNHEEPGMVFGEFEGGNIGRFYALLDHQERSLATIFGINGGEKGMIFQFKDDSDALDVWTAFYNEEDFKNQRVAYSDFFDLVDVPNTRMEIDLREADHWLRGTIEMDLVALRDNARMIPMALNEGLDSFNEERRKKGTKVLEASLADGTAISVIQDPSQGDVDLILPRALIRGEKATVKMKIEAEHGFMTWEGDFHYPLSTVTWYPRARYLGRSRYDVTFLHKSKTMVISVGRRANEGPTPDGKGMRTEWASDEALPIFSFAVGPFERHSDKVAISGQSIPVEFYSAPSRYAAIKEDFIVAELMNNLKFFSLLFGEYPYHRLGAAFFPSYFGQGLPTMLLLPVEGRAGLRDFAFMAHETSHQWWGNQVAWRSYRDQWLSEGFAEYSAGLYSSSRKNPKEALDLVKNMREALNYPPATDTGLASGKLYEIGPLIMGHRLSSRRSRSAYTALVYDKGALVLRMLHFLFTDPNGADDKAFYEMMKDFVRRNQGGWASTESFMAVASEHFAQTPVARKYHLQNLNWFLEQWVYEAAIPKYHLSYSLTPRPEGGVLMTGTLSQEGVPDQWFMPLPLVAEYEGNQRSQGTIYALGPKTAVKVLFPKEPKHILLDPDLWVLEEKVSVERSK